MGSRKKVVKLKKKDVFYIATVSAACLFLLQICSTSNPVNKNEKKLRVKTEIIPENVIDRSLDVRTSSGVGLIAKVFTSASENNFLPKIPFSSSIDEDTPNYDVLSKERKKYNKEIIKYQKRVESGTAEGEEYPRVTWETPTAPRLTSVYASPEILSRGCSITVVFLDPRTPAAPYTDATWYMLESVAKYLGIDDETVCVVLQTSACVLEEERAKALGIDPSVESHEEVLDLEGMMSQAVYRRSFPLFRRMLERGQVRLTFIDHEKYNLKSCSNYYPPNAALMNMHYWRDEFIYNIDSDLVLYVQKDSVLCQEFDPENWRDIAFVGSPFPGDLNKLNAKSAVVHKTNFCEMAPKHWKHFTRNRVAGTNSHLPLELTGVCEEGRGLVGNGGLSLRSRAWMSEAILSCPHIEFSGLSEDLIPAYCNVNHDINEDSYFSIILTAIDAPLVVPWEASLFSLETYWTDRTDEVFGELSFEEKHGIVAHRWGKNGLEKFHQMHNAGVYDDLEVKDLLVIPIGMHKPWLYHSEKVLKTSQIQKECPLFQYVYADHVKENVIL